MSLDDYFNKKSKKKCRTKISTQELFEKMTAGPQQIKEELEKRPDEVLIKDYGEWEPIINDDVELDLANIRISDLAAEKTEEEQAAVESADSSKKSASKAVWAKKPVVEEEKPVVEEEKPVESTKPGTYIPIHLRTGASKIVGPPKVLPNLESAEEFPSLDAAIAQEKPKKQAPQKIEPQDNSWTEASQGHRINSGASGGAPVHLRRDDTDNVKYSSSSSYRENLVRRVGGVAPQEHSSSSPAPWVRGSVTGGGAPPVVQPSAPKPTAWVRGVTTGSSAPKPYVIPQQRNIMSFTQENRFAQLDES